MTRTARIGAAFVASLVAAGLVQQASTAVAQVRETIEALLPLGLMVLLLTAIVALVVWRRPAAIDFAAGVLLTDRRGRLSPRACRSHSRCRRQHSLFDRELRRSLFHLAGHGRRCRALASAAKHAPIRFGGWVEPTGPARSGRPDH
jgi:hypothetical protein